MGQVISHHYNLYQHPEVTPFPPDGPKKDPLFGFEDGRPEKVMAVTEEEMASAGIPTYRRDYCAHLFIDFQKCKRDNFPFNNCHHEVHEYETCMYSELVDAYKDYERERRLLVREQRIAKKKAKLELEE